MRTDATSRAPFQSLRTGPLWATLLTTAAIACSQTGSSGSEPTPTDLPDGMATTPALAFALDSGVDNPAVDGLAIRGGWARLEPTEGVYDFSSIDQPLTLVAAAAKKATLHVLASGYAQVTPTWLAAAGVQYYTGLRGSEPVPWDAVYLKKWSNFLTKLAEHLRGSPNGARIVHVTVAVPVPEMNLFACQNGFLDGKSIPYDRAKYLAAWQQMIDAYQTAFPTIQRWISAPQNGICLRDNDTQFFREVMTYALSRDATHHGLFAADLSAQGSARMQPYVDLASQAQMSFQPVAAFTNDPNGWVKGSLQQLYCSGLKLGGRYFEVYASDLTSSDPAVQAAITAIHQPTLCP